MMEADLNLAAAYLAAARRDTAYKGLLYEAYSKDAKGIDRHIWQAKSVAMFEALRETDELWGLLKAYEKKQPALKLVVQNPEKIAVAGMKSGNKAQLKAVTKESKQ